MKKIIFALVGIFYFSLSAYANDTITIYTSIEMERLPKYKELIQKKIPKHKIVWVRDSTGIITAKLLAEAKAPQADLAFGVAASSLLLLTKQNMLEPYTPQGLDKISPKMRDNNAIPRWVGMDAWASSFCVNTIELEKRNLPMPTSWQDLIKPEYKDLIAMPDPASSGTGYMNLTAWIQLFGEEEAWKYAEALMNNTKFLTQSGTAPATMAAQGEVVIGITSASFVQNLLKRKAPIKIIIPKEGVGWEIEAAALIKGSPQHEVAKQIMDLVTSDEIAELGSDFSGITARPEFTRADVKESADKMIENNFEWSAQNRGRLLKEWKKRFAK